MTYWKTCRWNNIVNAHKFKHITPALATRHWLHVNRQLALQWRHNGHDGVSNYQPHECLLNRLFGRRSKKAPKLRVAGLCAGNSPVIGCLLWKMTYSQLMLFHFCRDLFIIPFDFCYSYTHVFRVFIYNYNLQCNQCLCLRYICFQWTVSENWKAFDVKCDGRRIIRPHGCM